MSRLKDELMKAGQIARTKGAVGHDALNLAGGLAFASSPQAALYRQVATSLWSGDGYYERKQEWLTRFQANVAEVVAAEPRFAFQLSAYGRDKQGLSLRTSPVALYAEASTRPEARGMTGVNTAKTSFPFSLAREYGPRVLLRADDPNEALAYLRLHHKRLPHGVLRGIADTVGRFDAYQLAKYKTTGQIADVLRITHPVPADEHQRQLWGAARRGELPTPYTWETELSKATTDDEKREVWNRLLESGKLGIFALLRNVRNILLVNADIEIAMEQFTRERTIGSGILPFQFYKAYKAVLPQSSAVAERLMQAVEWSLEGIPKLPGRTLVVTDNSSSMDSVEQTRGMTNAEIGNLMGAMALRICEDGMAGTFGNEFALADTHPDLGLLVNKSRIDRCGKTTGHATEAWKIFHDLAVERVHVDRVVLFSDMQCYDGRTAAFNKLIGRRIGLLGGRSMAGNLEAYRQTVNPHLAVYVVNLHSQDNSSQFAPEQPVVELAGWSDSVLRFMAAMEAGEGALDRIRQDY